jgi:hypothetical protein
LLKLVESRGARAQCADEAGQRARHVGG